ncbi:NAD(P)-dependent alcohol dehydrogenase [Amycolatopsis jejuensis]|uniref:NAD(P)-dependent alcohol dehydrogenase n=1 Tax=Amycolatopsis jejuensis TaxID=330084 RepID=UPI0005275425|nr:NAD(P)-dependent alcohol dehydrogenase [Amycolatopsis jejuensis]
MKIQAAVTREKGREFSIEEVDLATPRDDEVIVRVVASGVCHTDLIVRDQYYPVPLPIVLGHEGSGVVERVGAQVRHVSPGDHVVLSYYFCGECRNCIVGARSYCLRLFACNFGGSRLDGSTTLSRGPEKLHSNFFSQSSWATRALVNARNVVKVRKDVPLELFGPLGCGVQTGAGAVLNSLEARPGSAIAVFGTGGVGLSAVMAAGIAGCLTIIAVDVNESRLALARDLGATHTLNPVTDDVVAGIQEITGGGAHYSIETTARPEVFRQAVDSLGLRGVCGLIGAAPMGTEATFDMNNILFGRTVRGIVSGDSIAETFIPQLIEFYLQGRFPLDKLVRYYNFDEVNEAARASERGEVVKAILRMPS